MTGRMGEGCVALVTGGNRGLGRETCRQLASDGFRVILTARNDRQGRAAIAELADSGLSVAFRPLDVTDIASISALAKGLKTEGIRPDVLVNNAGVAFDGFNAEVARNTLAANLDGPMNLTDALLDLMPDGAVVVMVSSGAGELTGFSPAIRRQFLDPDLDRATLSALTRDFVDAVANGSYASAGWPGSAYKVSKAGLNALTRILARDLAARDIKVNAVCPGWVRTDMGGSSAPRNVEKGAASIVWAAEIDRDGPTGGFFRDGRPIDW
ncbi:MAG: SDR family oxidoreductase [Bauldia sp.]|nr:SDR family oxidoreductase [Bauldia sp.]